MYYSLLSGWEDASSPDENICEAEYQEWHILEIPVCLENTPESGSAWSQKKDKISYVWSL